MSSVSKKFADTEFTETISPLPGGCPATLTSAKSSRSKGGNCAKQVDCTPVTLLTRSSIVRRSVELSEGALIPTAITCSVSNPGPAANIVYCARTQMAAAVRSTRLAVICAAIRKSNAREFPTTGTKSPAFPLSDSARSNRSDSRIGAAPDAQPAPNVSTATYTNTVQSGLKEYVGGFTTGTIPMM